jgi:hypothetical protein
MTFSGQARTYNTDDMCGDPANITSEILFRNPGYVNVDPISLHVASVGNCFSSDPRCAPNPIGTREEILLQVDTRESRFPSHYQ